MFKTLWYALKTWYTRKTEKQDFLTRWMLENAEAKRQDGVYKGKFNKKSII